MGVLAGAVNVEFSRSAPGGHMKLVSDIGASVRELFKSSSNFYRFSRLALYTKGRLAVDVGFIPRVV